MPDPVIPMLLLLTWRAKRFYVFDDISLVLERRSPGHDVLISFREMFWERGICGKRDFDGKMVL